MTILTTLFYKLSQIFYINHRKKKIIKCSWNPMWETNLFYQQNSFKSVIRAKNRMGLASQFLGAINSCKLQVPESRVIASIK